MQGERVEQPERHMVGWGLVTTNANGQGVQDIQSAWEQLNRQNGYEAIPYRVGEHRIGLYCQYEGDWT